MVTLDNATNIRELIANTEILIVECGSVTCAPCTAIRNRIDDYIASHSKLTALYVEIAENRALCGELGVFSSPTILVYVEGSLTIRESGYFSLSDIFRRIDRYISLLD